MIEKNINEPTNLKFDSNQKKILALTLLASGIYTIIVALILINNQIPEQSKIILTYVYLFTGPLSFYTVWVLGVYWKTKKIPKNVILGKNTKYLLLFFLLGVCVINWAAYWNTGIDMVWLLIFALVYIITDNLLLATVIYIVGASAITPAFVEEFLKAFPSIIAFFVVIQRSKNSEQKNKGILGNELNGFLIGIMIGLAFEIFELWLYILLVSFSGGTYEDIFLQAFMRTWSPFHLMGGAVSGYAVGRAERLRFELGEENLPMKIQIKKFLKRFLPYWFIPVTIHFLWNSSSVWIILIDYAINGQMTLLSFVLQIITLSILSGLIYMFLIIFLRRATKIAEKTRYCPVTGLIVAKEGTLYNLNDTMTTEVRESEPDESEEIITGSEVSCPNCNQELNVNFKFCTNCGFNLDQLLSRLRCPQCGQVMKKKSNFCTNCGKILRQFEEKPRLYKKKTTVTFILGLIGISAFLALGIILMILYIIILGPIGVLLISFQLTADVICSVLMIYATYTLFKLWKNYDGRKSVWGWIFFVFNIVGLLITFIVFGIALVILSFIFGEVFFILLLIGIGVIGINYGIVLLVFTWPLLKREQQVLQYQRKF